MNQRARHAPASCRLLLRDDDIDWHAHWWQSIAQPHHLVELALHLLLDHEEVEIAVIAGAPASPRSEKHDPRWRTGSRRQKSASILDYGIVDHGAIVAAASQISLGMQRSGKTKPE